MDDQNKPPITPLSFSLEGMLADEQRKRDLQERQTKALELACSAFVHLANAVQKLCEKAAEDQGGAVR